MTAQQVLKSKERDAGGNHARSCRQHDIPVQYLPVVNMLEAQAYLHEPVQYCVLWYRHEVALCHGRMQVTCRAQTL